MAYRVEQNQLTGEQEIMIDGWERGIADSPHLGLADMRNVNIDSNPGIAFCNYRLGAVTQTPIVTKAFTASVAGSSITWTGTALLAGKAITFAGADLPDPLVAGTIYYTGAAGNTTTLFSKNDPWALENTAVTLTDTGSGTMTFSTVNMGIPKDYCVDQLINYVIDSNGRVWWFDYHASWVPFNQTSLGAGEGLAVYKKFLFVFRSTNLDYLPMTAGASWVDGWKTPIASSYHHAKWCQDNILYFCNGNYIGSINQSGVETNIATYTFNGTAQVLPTNESASWFEEHIINLIIGTSTSNLLYMWDRTSTSYIVPLPLPEIGTYKLLNINRIVYILAGQRGNIYYTNGSSVTLFKTLPKYCTGVPYPLITWGGIMSLNNNLCFGVEAKNAETVAVVNGASGCWAITLAVGELLNSIAGAIRYKGQPSAGKYNTTVLIPISDGISYQAGWYDGTYGGMDLLTIGYPSTQFYSNYESYIETDIISIGTALQPRTFNTIEVKFDTPLIAGEKVRVKMRGDLKTSYSTVFELTSAGGEIDANSSGSGVPIQLNKWMQFKVEIQTIAGSTRSYVRLKEVRIR